jgi:hypothetical protein
MSSIFLRKNIRSRMSHMRTGVTAMSICALWDCCVFALDWFSRFEIVRDLLRQIPTGVWVYLSPGTVVLVGISGVFIEVLIRRAKVGFNGGVNAPPELPIRRRDSAIHLHLHDISAAAVHIEVTSLDSSNKRMGDL